VWSEELQKLGRVARARLTKLRYAPVTPRLCSLQGSGPGCQSWASGGQKLLAEARRPRRASRVVRTTDGPPIRALSGGNRRLEGGKRSGTAQSRSGMPAASVLLATLLWPGARRGGEGATAAWVETRDPGPLTPLATTTPSRAALRWLVAAVARGIGGEDCRALSVYASPLPSQSTHRHCPRRIKSGFYQWFIKIGF
jgi:hypothetical protein